MSYKTLVAAASRPSSLKSTSSTFVQAPAKVCFFIVDVSKPEGEKLMSCVTTVLPLRLPVKVREQARGTPATVSCDEATQPK